MQQTAAYINKFNAVMDHGWPWVLIVPALLILILMVVPIGMWINAARRNRLLEEEVSAIKYQTEILKWLGQRLGHGRHLESVDVREAPF